MHAFGGTGVRIPGTAFRLRHDAATSVRSFVEPMDGAEQAELPEHWRQGVLVIGNGEKFTWIGKRVRSYLIGNVDLSLYRDTGDGWELPSE